MRYSRDSMYIVCVALLAVLIVIFGFSGLLDTYIHPRYVHFTVFFSCLALVMLAIPPARQRIHSHGPESIWSYVPFLIIIIAVIFLPVKSLTSATISQRSGSGSVVATLSDYDQQGVLFSGSSRAMNLVQWSKSLSLNTSGAYYRNKPANVSGFLYDTGDPNVVNVSRFVVTCCAVDAQPVSISMYVENWRKTYSQDQWVRVEGEFRRTKTNDGDRLVLHPTKIEKIDEPENPYAN